ncbi:MAG: alpha-amylase [Prevotella sp.]|nr:alpha-amylase [Prevotella sp.]
MKRISTLLVMMMTTLLTMAQGWPENYGGVMLQGFYWDSFNDTQWTRLEKQADELATTFDLVWIPQSASCGGTSMGYDDLYWFSDYTSSFGNEQELRALIKALKEKGIGTIADVVLNHRRTLNQTFEFPEETYQGVTYKMLSTDICGNDLSNWTGSDGQSTKTYAQQKGYEVSSHNDTGEGWGGMPDLDHYSDNVQTIVKAYLHMLLEDFGYAGFRYDMVKGYASRFTKTYNEDAKPQFSVGEYWDSSRAIKNWIDNSGKSSAAFDFQFKYVVRNATDKGDWTCLGKNNDSEDNWPLISDKMGDGTYRRYAVTFVENHDTEVRPDGSSNGPLKKDTLAANAYLLAMPGTPCVFLKHWKAYKQEIANMATVRKAVGITNVSTPEQVASLKDYYAVKVKGNNGELLAVVGTKAADFDPGEGWKKAISGYHYAYYVSGIDPESIVYPTFKPSDFKPYTITVSVNADQVGWTDGVNFWTWGGDGSHAPTNTKWPGDKVTQTAVVGGKTWFTREFTINEEADAVSFVFSTGSGSPQTVDVTNVTTDKYLEISSSKNGESNYLVNDVTDNYITAILPIAQGDRSGVRNIYTLDGRLVRTGGSLNGLPKGIYIIGNKKYILK